MFVYLLVTNINATDFLRSHLMTPALIKGKIMRLFRDITISKEKQGSNRH